MLRKLMTAPYSDLGVLVLRVALGLSLFIGHGYGKVMNFQEGLQHFMDPIGISPQLSFVLATAAESLAALLVVVGLLTRPAALSIVVLFMVIYCFAMVNVPEDAKAATAFYNAREGIRLFFFGFLAVLLAGPGKYSIDALLFKSKSAY